MIILYYPLASDKFTITQRFGENPDYYPTSKGHNGIDWGIPVGTPVYSMTTGEVIRADETDGKRSYGRHVRIRDNSGIAIYGHLSQIDVKVGQTLDAKARVGLSGGAVDDPGSGSSTGPHLHAEYRLFSGAPQVAGGFVFNAINILPLLVSQSWIPENSKPLYYITPRYEDICVRQSPIKTGKFLRLLGWGSFPIYAEENGYGLINTSKPEWVSVNPEYSEITKTITDTLTIRQRLDRLEDRLTKIERKLSNA